MFDRKSQVDSSAVVQQERQMNGILLKRFRYALKSSRYRDPLVEVRGELSDGFIPGELRKFENHLGIVDELPLLFLRRFGGISRSRSAQYAENHAESRNGQCRAESQR